ncbi:MAG: CDP-alcohol phosphatidyltransferase family protein [Candidatus Methanoplasma sp.]|jgi:phosphatidylglycerophosphate synthase|nr:CDP-alcohol phosphatidyltransferase family protein [Candidatus Methanoplasma sp.]
MDAKNSTFAVTLSRVPLTVTFCATQIFVDRPLLPCAALFATVAATDFLDGRIARRRGVQSDAGAVLDVVCDFFFIASACFVLWLQGLLPWWILATIALKFSEFWSTSALFRRRDRRKPVFVSDPVGRAVAALFYLLPISTLAFRAVLSDSVFEAAVVVSSASTTMLALASSMFRLSSSIRRKEDVNE